MESKKSTRVPDCMTKKCYRATHGEQADFPFFLLPQETGGGDLIELLSPSSVSWVIRNAGNKKVGKGADNER